MRGVRDADRGDADIGRTTPVTAPYFGLAAGSGMCRVPRLRKGTPWFMGRDCAVRLCRAERVTVVSRCSSMLGIPTPPSALPHLARPPLASAAHHPFSSEIWSIRMSISVFFSSHTPSSACTFASSACTLFVFSSSSCVFASSDSARHCQCPLFNRFGSVEGLITLVVRPNMGGNRGQNCYYYAAH